VGHTARQINRSNRIALVLLARAFDTWTAASVQCAMDVRARLRRRRCAVGRLPSRGRNDGQPRRELTARLSSGRCPEGAGHSPAAWALCTYGRGRSSRGVSHLVALSLHFGCPVADPPSALALSPKRAPSAVRSAWACASLGEVRRGAAGDRSPGGFAPVVGGVGRRSVRSMARCG
jgi:hypothetical protein